MGHGHFTRGIIEGIGCNTSGYYTTGNPVPADSNGDWLITLSEIYNKAYSIALSMNPDQHAMSYGTGSTVIFRRK